MDASEERSRLSRDVFMALAAVAWSDGSLDPDEADAIVRAALEEGLDLDTVAEIEEATRSPVALGTLDRHALTREERLFVYGMAKWIARMDGVITQAESSILERLAGHLDIPDRARAQVEGSCKRSPSCRTGIARRSTISGACASSFKSGCSPARARARALRAGVFQRPSIPTPAPKCRSRETALPL